MKNKLFMLLNIAGMTLGIGCAIVAYFNWDFHTNFDQQHIKYPEVVKINTTRVIDGIKEKHAISPMPLGPQAKSSIPAILDYSRYIGRRGNVRRGDKVLANKIGFVDSSFMKLFHFPLLKGSTAASESPGKIIITKSIERAYFGADSGLGESLTLLLEDDKHELIIGAVIEDHKLNSSFKFDILMSTTSFENLYSKDLGSWSEMADATFIRLTNKTDLNNLQNLLSRFIEPQNTANEEWLASQYFVTPFNKMADEARYLRNNRLGQNNPDGTILIPTIMAVMILLIACFNFTNTSLAIAANRIKEIGVRKALGAKKSQLQWQLIIESMSIVCLSVLLGMVLAEFLLPVYSSLGPWIELSSDYSENILFFLFLFILAISTGLLSAAYPALYISNFNVISIFQKKIKVKNTNWLTKSLLILQIAFSIMAIIQGVVYIQNSTLQKEFDLGFNRSDIISIPLAPGSQYRGLKNSLSQLTDIESVAMTNHHLGYSRSGGKFKTSHFEDEVRVFEVGPNYITTMHIELTEGKNFHLQNDSSQLGSILINETLASQFQITDFSLPYTFNDEPYQVIGIVKDFYPNGLWRGEMNHPAVLKLSSENNYKFMIINTGSNDVSTMNSRIREQWKEFNPEIPYEGELNNKQVYLSELLSNNMTYFSFFQAVVASLLSITGLFTMVSLNIQNRQKEMSLRKVLGATDWGIFKLYNVQIIVVIITASFLGVFGSYYLTELFLDIMFSIHAHVNLQTVLISLTSLMILTYSVVGYKLFNSSNTSPVEALKQE